MAEETPPAAPPPPPPPPPPPEVVVNIDLGPVKDQIQRINAILQGEILPAFTDYAGGELAVQDSQRREMQNQAQRLSDLVVALETRVTSLQVALQGQLANNQGRLTIDLQTLGALIGGGLGQLGQSFETSNDLTQLLTKIAAFLSALIADRNTLPGSVGGVVPAAVRILPPGSEDNVMVDILGTAGRKVEDFAAEKLQENIKPLATAALETLLEVFEPVTGKFTDAMLSAIDFVRTPANALNGVLFGAIVAGTLRDIEKLDAGKPENVAANSATLLVDLMNRGLNASLLTKIPELFHPLKHLGFGQMAAFSADLAGFGPVAGAIHSPAVNAAIGTPQRYAMNARFQPTLPSEGDLEELFRKKQITAEDYLSLMSYHGYSARWSSLKLSNIHKDLTLGDISRVIEDTDMGADWILRMVQQRGLNDEDSALVADSLTQKITRTERGRVIAAALAGYQQGIGSREDLLLELESLGLRPEKINLLVRGADLRAAQDYAEEAQKMVLQQYRDDQITEGELSLSLSMLGYRPERVEIVVAIETTKKTAKIARAEKSVAEREIRRVQAASIPFYREQFLQGLLTAGEYQSVLVELGIEEAIAAATVGVDALKVSAREGRIKSADVQREQRQILQASQQAIIEQYQKDLITEAQFAGGLADLGIPADLLNAILLRERAVKVPAPRRFVPPPPELLERTIADRSRQVILTRYGKGLIDRATAFNILVDTGQDPRLAQEDLNLEEARTYRVGKPPKPTSEQLATQRAQRDEQLVRYRAGLIDAAGLRSALVRIVGDEPLADALVELEEAKRQAAAIAADKRAAEAAEKAAERERERAAKAAEAARKKEEEAAKRAAEKAAREEEAERERIEKEARNIRRDALIKQYRARLLDEQGLFEALLEAGLDIDVAAAIVEREAVAAPAEE